MPQRGRQLLVAAADEAVELQGQRLLQRGADRGRLRHSGAPQVVAGDLEPHAARALQVGVQALRHELRLARRSTTAITRTSSGWPSSSSCSSDGAGGASPDRRSAITGPSVTAAATTSWSRRRIFRRSSHSYASWPASPAHRQASRTSGAARLGERSLHRRFGGLHEIGRGTSVEMRVQRAVEAQLGHALQRRARRCASAEQVEQLVAQPRGRQVADQPHVDAAARQRQGVRVHRGSRAAPRSGSRAAGASGPRRS